MTAQEITTFATTLLFGGGWLLQTIKGHQERKKRNAEVAVTSADAESKAVKIALDSATEWKDIAEKRELKLEERDRKIDALYLEKGQDRQLIFSLQKEVADLKVCKTAMAIRLCNKKSCTEREPQTGY